MRPSGIPPSAKRFFACWTALLFLFPLPVGAQQPPPAVEHVHHNAMALVKTTRDEWIRENVIDSLGALDAFQLLLVDLERTEPVAIGLAKENGEFEARCTTVGVHKPFKKQLDEGEFEKLLADAANVIKSEERTVRVETGFRSYALMLRRSGPGLESWVRVNIENPPPNGNIDKFISRLLDYWYPFAQKLAEEPPPRD